ncbi:LysR substrate-binding domain-containing protein [Sphingomonas alpina]|uniref:LysR family transcriptional regulator n=1 Tax=Sphingomonas alpina TaxID=653931 RepID=A0A7H0LJG1_9SPHN|nr:LysR substrate-binding domain-containing protein [Sphingomonas alpina]QNQ09814.1 LysR family transcriptional regulator [Sphingomonas alpina]
MQSPNLDMDVLRTLVLAEQLGGFVHAAGRIGRSQSAVSQQIRKIEEQVGQTLFRKQGRGLVATAAGETLLVYARRILELNDEALVAINGLAAGGTVRLGLPGDFADTWLPAVLGRFNRALPTVRLEAVVDRNRVLIDRLDRGELDLVLAINQAHRPDAMVMERLPAIWIGPEPGRLAWNAGDPLPLVLSDPPCFFRQRALAVLEEAGIPWRVVLTSPGVQGIWAAVEAGLGVTLRIAIGLPPALRRLGAADGVPNPTGEPFALSLHDGGRALPPSARQLYDFIGEAVVARMSAGISGPG